MDVAVCECGHAHEVASDDDGVVDFIACRECECSEMVLDVAMMSGDSCICGAGPSLNLKLWIDAQLQEPYEEREERQLALGIDVLKAATREASQHGIFGTCYEIEEQIRKLEAS